MLIGDDIETGDGSGYSPLPHYFSCLPIRDTLLRVLELPTAVRVPISFGEADVARVVAAAAEALRAGSRGPALALTQRHLKRLDGLLEAQWSGIKAIMDQGDLVGEGGSSKVFRGTLLNYPAGPVAVKVHTVPKAIAHSMRAFQNEIDLMTLLDHPNVLPLLSTHVRAKGMERYLITPYCAGGSLEHWLFGGGGAGLASGQEIGRAHV